MTGVAQNPEIVEKYVQASNGLTAGYALPVSITEMETRERAFVARAQSYVDYLRANGQGAPGGLEGIIESLRTRLDAGRETTRDPVDLTVVGRSWASGTPSRVSL